MKNTKNFIQRQRDTRLRRWCVEQAKSLIGGGDDIVARVADAIYRRAIAGREATGVIPTQQDRQ